VKVRPVEASPVEKSLAADLIPREVRLRACGDGGGYLDRCTRLGGVWPPRHFL